MSVDPTKSHPAPGGGAGGVRRTTPQPPAETPRPRREPDAAGVPQTSADAVELSEAARELLLRVGRESPPDATLTPERLREIAARLGSGFYDRPEVMDEVLRKLAKDL